MNIAIRNIAAAIALLILAAACSDTPASLEEIVETTSPSVVQIDAGIGSGSGFIISKDGFVVTNAHILGNERKVKVWLSNGRKYDAEVMGSDLDTDLAVVKIDDDEQFDVLPLGNPEDTSLGMEVVALGFPLADIGDNLTVTRGILSSTRTLDGVDFLQTDAALNPGNSGGPLINHRGEVIGINTFKVSGFDVDNLGFAVSIVELEHRLDDMKERQVFLSVSSGGRHTCGLREDGIAVCWGDDEYSQAMPPEDERLTSISSGGRHTCGLREDGIAVCWGDNEYSQAMPPEDERLTSISSGGRHTCGLREDSIAVCWGDNDSGQAMPPEDERFKSISSGSFHTCGLREDGIAVCWGDNDSGQAMPPEDERFKSISSGRSDTCGLREDGIAVCWRDNDSGQAMPPEGERFESISRGGWHTCGLRKDGIAVCWGYKFLSKDGFPVPYVTTTPLDEHFTAISSGGFHTCGLMRDNGSVVCWGENEYGQASPPLR